MRNRQVAASTFVGTFSALCLLVVSGCGSEQQRWEEARDTGTVPAYEEFLSRHPDGVYADSAQTQVERLRFQEALAANTIESYEEFLSRHPDGVNADSAQIQIERLRFQGALAANTIEAYERFLSHHPDGASADSAQGQIQWLRLQEALAANTIQAYQEFLSLHPEGMHADSASSRLTGLYFVRARNAGTLQQIRYLQESGRRELSNDQGMIATRGRVAGQQVIVDAATGDTVHTSSLDARGNPSDPRLLCLDEAGNIVERSGRPVLVEPFSHSVIRVRGEMLSYVQYDVYGRPDREYSSIRGCVDCAQKTGITNCVFVW